MRENNSELWNQHKTYKHHFPDGRVVDALMYPIDALPMFIRYVNERWLYENAEKYFKEREALNREIKELEIQVKGMMNELPAGYDGEVWRNKKLQRKRSTCLRLPS